MREGKVWLFWILLFAGIILGGLLGQLAQSAPFLSWMAYGQSFGLEQPLNLDLGILNLTFGIMFNLNVASIIGVLLAMFIYRKV
ncbi:MAG: DUF4321 domain-containing protein [Clostridia bacterium]|nr:DUF4321 domain-containing protein [Clostridia bacterium]